MDAAHNAKLAIVGAGSVGASIAYAALIRNSARQITLYDINEAKVNAEVLDLAHSSQFAGSAAIEGNSDVSVVSGARVVVITAGAKTKPGQSRLDLAETNIAILRELMPRLVEQAPDAVYVLVTNPCDVLTVAAREISGLPRTRVLSAGTVLDTARLRWLLAGRAGVAQRSVHAHIVGEHGDTQFPIWSTATIGVTPLREWTHEGSHPFSAQTLEEIAEEVRTAAYTVVRGKGATNYAIGLSAARIVEAIMRDERVILPVSTVLADFPRLEGLSGVALSVPSVLSAAGAHAVEETPMSAQEAAQLRASAEKLLEVQRTLGP